MVLTTMHTFELKNTSTEASGVKFVEYKTKKVNEEQ